MKNELSQSFIDSMVSKDIGELNIDSLDCLSDIKMFESLHIPFISSTLKITVSISNFLFMKKCLIFFKGINDIPQEKRYEFLGDLSVRDTNNAGEIIMSIIDRIDHPKKIELLVELFKARVNDEISIDDFIRLSFSIEKVPYNDLLTLKEKESTHFINGRLALLESAGLIYNDCTDQGGADGIPTIYYTSTDLGIHIIRIIKKM